ncbi:MAG: methyl-accepting chemotaxis protein, partial [Oscillospiraceae bacterium]|nr:methyl-accepting chemotaxis protein [Oscillospiraceae bacterium]
AYSADSLLNLTTVRFDIEAYKKDPASYLDYLNDGMGDFIRHIISESNYITSAYIVPHPDLAGYPYVGEIYYCQTDDGIELVDDPPTYEMYDETDPDYQWFYGAYNSGNPYWSPVYLDITGITMVSYTMPIYINGEKAGVVGVDISIAHIEELIKHIHVYDTGFTVLEDRYGEFFETNSIIEGLSSAEREKLSNTARANDGEVFDVNLGGVTYMAAARPLMNGYTLYIAAPKSEVNAEVTASVIRFIFIFATAYAIVLVVAYFIGKKMGGPVGALSAFMRRAGTTGDIVYTEEDEKTMTRGAEIGGEIGQLIQDCAMFMKHIFGAARELEAIANGDLTVEIETLSDNDTMAVSFNKMLKNLNRMFNDVNSSAVQVSSGSKQIADGAASLAKGATEQSASIDELTLSINKIREQTNKNAAVAREAADMSGVIMDNAEKGSSQMDEMMQAVKDIDDASSQISKVIKVIDDIAFQTNILALNAAVEAARAGQHGKGFAVVAEEVRSLAQKSAAAAKDTGGLIEDTVGKAHLGMKIATETAQSLKGIVDGISQSAGIIEEIANESTEQLSAIAHLNTGIGQVSQIIQQNSAAAQESAASAEEMSGQSAILEDLISQFKLTDKDAGQRLLPPR